METEILITFAIVMLSMSSGYSNAIHFQSLPVHDQLAYTIHKVSTSSQSSYFPPNSLGNPLNTALKLVHRDKFSIHGKKSYWHLFQERLHRDSKRVAGLSLLHKNTSNASLIYKLQDFGSVVVSGAEEGIGEYFVKVGIGSPLVYQYMVIDTGSDVTWIQCQPCMQCYPQADPIFDPASSASFERVTCGSVACGLLDKTSECGSGPCQYEVTYEDGSYYLGLFSWASGLLGLGGGAMSLVGQLGGQTGGAFGYCLASPGSESDGSLFFGRSASISTGTTWVPLLRNALKPSFYYIDLVGLGVGGVRVTVPEEAFQL